MRRLGKALVTAGVVFLGLGAVFWLLVPGVAVKYPGGGLDKTAIANGTFTLYVDPATTAPRQPAQQLPLRIERRLQVVDNSPGSSVVQEDDAEFVGPLPRQDFEQRYILDRSNVRNLSDLRAYAYAPDNLVDRSPNYSINLPFQAGKGPYSVWKNETGSAYPFTRVGTVSRNGVELARYHGTLTDAAVQPYYIAQLARQGIPQQLTPAQTAIQLKAAGVDPTALTAVVLPRLQPADRREIASILAAPVPLGYRLDVDTTFLVEPRTGAIVDLEKIDQTLHARPDIQGVGRVQAILAKPAYAKDAVVTSASATVQRLVAQPPETPIFRLQYGQTPASVDDLVAFADGRGDRITLVTQTVPAALAVTGALLVFIGVLLLFRSPRPGPVVPTPDRSGTPPRTPVGA